MHALYFLGHSYANIVSLPHTLYVLEGKHGIVRCQNRSLDEGSFYSQISNATWWRNDTNGTSTRIGTSGTVYSSRHTLNFNPMSSESQGYYYCCLPDSESTCSKISDVRQSSKLAIATL